MKKTFLKTAGALTLAVLVLAVFAQISVFTQEFEKQGQPEEAFLSNGNAHRLEGSWSASVAFTNCRTGAPVSPPFAAMNTFMRGGTMQDFGVTSGMFRSQGHGVWKHEGGLNYSKAFQFFRFNTDGTYAERIVVRCRIEFRPDDNYVATCGIEIYDPNGNLVRRACSSETATRFE